MIFNNINKPEPHEIKFWLKELNFTINDASNALGISKRQIAKIIIRCYVSKKSSCSSYANALAHK